MLAAYYGSTNHRRSAGLNEETEYSAVHCFCVHQLNEAFYMAANISLKIAAT